MMMTSMQLAQADALVLASYLKPVVAFALFAGWSWLVVKLDKDAGYFYLQRNLFNALQLTCGVLGLLALLFIPFFIIGLVVCIILMVGGAAGYWFYRNGQVPDEAKWSFSVDKITEQVDARQRESAQKSATFRVLNPDESPRTVPAGNDPMAEPHEQLEQLLDWTLARGGEQINIQVTAEKAAIVARVDGVKTPQPEMPPKTTLKLVDYIKHSAELDVQERRKRQRGELKFHSDEYDRHMAEVITMGSSAGLSMTLNIDADRIANRKLPELGLIETQAEQVRKIVESPGKVVLVTGPHHHGVRSTVLSLISQHDPYMHSIMTLETERRFELEGVDHNYLDPNDSPEVFNNKLATLIRTDPAAICLGSLPDASTLKLVAEAAEHVRFYLPMRADTGFAALKMYAKGVGDARLASESLGAIISQRLVRKLCLTCRVPYKPDPAALKKMNLPADRITQLYKASGKVKVKDKLEPCLACRGIGYRGRVGVFEVLAFDDLGRSMIAGNEGERLRSHLRKNNTVWLQEAALEKVVEGVTDIREVTRVIGEK